MISAEPNAWSRQETPQTPDTLIYLPTIPERPTAPETGRKIQLVCGGFSGTGMPYSKPSISDKKRVTTHFRALPTRAHSFKGATCSMRFAESTPAKVAKGGSSGRDSPESHSRKRQGATFPSDKSKLMKEDGDGHAKGQDTPQPWATRWW